MTTRLDFLNYLMMLDYVLGIEISTFLSLYHLIFKIGTITPIVQMRKSKVEEFSKVIFVSWKITEHG